METYVLIAISAYLLFALNGVIDKFLLGKGIPKPVVFAFYIGVGSSLVLLLSPFGFSVPSAKIIIVSLLSGLAFFFALISLYSSLKFASASRVLPTIGGLVPLITFPLSIFIVGEQLSFSQFAGMLLLAASSLLLAVGARAYSKQHHWFLYAMLASGLFALSFTLSKIVYLDQAFISGLIWTRLGLIAGALLVLVVPSVRKQIFTTTKQAGKPTGVLFLLGQAIGASAGILQNYAVALGSVVVVNALQGTQFAILFILTSLLSRWFPKVLKEDISKKIILPKLIAITLIIVGLILVA